LDFLGLKGVGLEPKTETATIPHMLFMVYQLMFAIITPAIMTGATAERLRFPAYLLVILLWSLSVYVPLAHWVWRGGWLADMGVLDFAGGTVVHISSGFSGLIAAMIIGKRFNKDSEKTIPHNLPYDDALDAFGIHGIGGTWGTLAAGLFCTTSLSPNSVNGLYYSGSFSQLGIQAIAVVATFAYSGTATLLILKAVGFLTPLTASQDEQETGLDITQHGESAYPDLDGMTSTSAWNL